MSRAGWKTFYKRGHVWFGCTRGRAGASWSKGQPEQVTVNGLDQKVCRWLREGWWEWFSPAADQGNTRLLHGWHELSQTGPTYCGAVTQVLVRPSSVCLQLLPQHSWRSRSCFAQLSHLVGFEPLKRAKSPCILPLGLYCICLDGWFSSP